MPENLAKRMTPDKNMGEPKMGFVPEEEMEKLKSHHQAQAAKGWEGFDGSEWGKNEEDKTENDLHQDYEDQQREEMYGSPEKIARLKELKDMIDLKKIPRIYCSSTEHDRALPSGMYFLASDELAQIEHNLKQIDASGTSTRIIFKDKTSLPVPDNCLLIRDTLSEYSDIDGKKLVDQEDDYYDLNRAKMYKFIAEDEERLRYFSKESEPKDWAL